LHVGLDLLFLVPGESGGRETYARELIAALRREHGDLRLTTFVNRDTARSGWEHDDLPTVVLPVSATDRASWARGEVWDLPRAAERACVDVLHSTGNFGPAHGRFARVLTLHDLLHRLFPQFSSPLMRAGTEVLLGTAAHRAHQVVCGSEASRQELVRRLRVPGRRVAVTPYGLGSTPTMTRDPGVLGRLDIDRPYLLSVASHLPHKSLATAVRALAHLPADGRPLLVLVGAGTNASELARAAHAAGVAGDVRQAGLQPVAALESLYARAAAVVVTTLHEGFGFPVLEAMHRGIPVVCSDLAVLREVAGGAARFFTAGDSRGLAQGVGALLDEPHETDRLRALGRERAAMFSWAQTALTTRAAYTAALTAARRR
jgi:glycosyltransferase involved in cell wall biosynthesis